MEREVVLPEGYVDLGLLLLPDFPQLIFAGQVDGRRAGSAGDAEPVAEADVQSCRLDGPEAVVGHDEEPVREIFALKGFHQERAGCCTGTAERRWLRARRSWGECLRVE